MTVYDLSVPTADGVDWYADPDCAPVDLHDVGSRAEVGWVSHHLSLMVLNGCTYLETAGHVLEGGATLDDVPPERFITRAFVVKLPGESQVLPAPEADVEGFEPGSDALLLHCGWDAHMHQPDYYHASPYFSAELQEWVLRHQPGILGGDMLSFDDPAGDAMPFVNEYFARGGIILCPLVGLERLPLPVVTLCATPLRLAGANAAPCRALAW